MVPLVNEVGDPSDVANKAHRNNERITARHISLLINPTIIAIIIAITNNFNKSTTVQEYVCMYVSMVNAQKFLADPHRCTARGTCSRM